MSALYRIGLLATTWAAAINSVISGTITGPSSSQSPYVVGSKPGVVTVSLLSVGDSVNSKPDGVTPYRMAGIPDGLGAFDNGDNTFTLLMNHEIASNRGVVRDHGFIGSFVSKWIVDKESLSILHGEDLIKELFQWSGGGFVLATRPISRLCSADLPEVTAFFNPVSGLGYEGMIFLNGEEAGNEGRAFAHLLDGRSFELPWLGKFSWENAVAHPETGEKTVVVGLDDSGSGQVYVYRGDKSSSIDPLAAAGLREGSLLGVKVEGLLKETDATAIIAAPFTVVDFGNVVNKTGAELETESNAAGVTAFNRPEDGAWDPKNPGDFYFVTTASFGGKSRLWRLRFNDPSNPAAGGIATVILNGTEGPKMMDNMTISKRGSIFIQEDVGNQPHLGRIWRYSIATGTLEIVAAHDANRFLPGSLNFLTADEESSGMIPMDDILGTGWYLADVQAHYNPGDTELVEGGQLIAIHFPSGLERK